MCSVLGCTPSELGQARRRNKFDIEFLERSYILRKEKEVEAMKKSQSGRNQGKSIRRM